MLSPYQNVMSTGAVTSSRASTGHGGSDASGVVVVVTAAVLVVVSPGTVGPVDVGGPGATVVVVGSGSLPALRIDSPDEQAASRAPPRRATIRARTAQPFTAPEVRPRSSWRWKTRSTMTIGTAAMSTPAMTRLG